MAMLKSARFSIRECVLDKYITVQRTTIYLIGRYNFAQSSTVLTHVKFPPREPQQLVKIQTSITSLANYHQLAEYAMCRLGQFNTVFFLFVQCTELSEWCTTIHTVPSIVCHAVNWMRFSSSPPPIPFLISLPNFTSRTRSPITPSPPSSWNLSHQVRPKALSRSKPSASWCGVRIR